MYYSRPVRELIAGDWKDAYEQGHHTTDALRDALEVMPGLLDRIATLESEREQIRAVLKGYSNSNLASLATTLTVRNDALEAALGRLILAFDVGDVVHATVNGRGYAALAEARALLEARDVE